MQLACVMNEHEYELYLIYTQSKNKQTKKILHTVYTVMCPSYTNFESILINFVTLFVPFWLAEVTLDWSGGKKKTIVTVGWFEEQKLETINSSPCLPIIC